MNLRRNFTWYRRLNNHPLKQVDLITAESRFFRLKPMKRETESLRVFHACESRNPSVPGMPAEACPRESGDGHDNRVGFPQMMRQRKRYVLMLFA
jgi:hypothetical protein